MTTQHPITPPPELIRNWSRFQGDTDLEALWFRICTAAAQWGADQELEACCEWLGGTASGGHVYVTKLRAARRPKPPSLKAQALEALEAHFAALQAGEPTYRPAHKATIRRALEELPDD